MSDPFSGNPRFQKRKRILFDYALCARYYVNKFTYLISVDPYRNLKK